MALLFTKMFWKAVSCLPTQRKSSKVESRLSGAQHSPIGHMWWYNLVKQISEGGKYQSFKYILGSEKVLMPALVNNDCIQSTMCGVLALEQDFLLKNCPKVNRTQPLLPMTIPGICID